MGNENQSNGGDDLSKQPGGGTIMNDRTSGRQGAGVRQSDQSGSGRSQQGGSQIDKDNEEADSDRSKQRDSSDSE
jgi:hypothetical protein